MEPLLETWRIHNRIHLYLIDAIPNLAASLTKGRAVVDQFGHIHNTRLLWLKASAPELLEGLEKHEKGTGDAESLKALLVASGAAIESLLVKAGTPEGKVKGFKPHAGAFLGYLVSHESHHRGMVEIALRQAGTPIDDKTSYGLWEWGVR